MRPPEPRLYSASIYAIGNYLPSLIDCFEYPTDMLTSLRAGTSVCIAVVSALGDQVEDLAALLGIDPLDPGQHHLDPARIDAAALEQADLATAASIERLRDAGFSFHFLLDPEPL
jgi:hypothetical protein